MEIIETADYYVVTFFPNATEAEIDDKPEKGYKAIIGEQGGEHVVMKVMYSKAMYDLTKVIELAQNIKECPICKRLDANVANIDRMQLSDTTPNIQVPTVPVRAAQTQATSLSTGNPFHDMMAQLMFDTKLNPTGQVIAAAALEDDALMSKATDKKEIPVFRRASTIIVS
jgi:hypothetical protein